MWALLGEVALSTLAIYLFLIVLIRLIGRRTLTQLSALDLLVTILLGSAVETAMVQASTSLRVGLVSASVLLVANRLITWSMLKSKRFRHLVGGGPLLLVHDGKIVQDHLWKAGLTEADLMAALRAREYGSVSNIRFAVLEPDGRINVIPSTALVHHGEVPAPRNLP